MRVGLHEAGYPHLPPTCSTALLPTVVDPQGQELGDQAVFGVNKE